MNGRPSGDSERIPAQSRGLDGIRHPGNACCAAAVIARRRRFAQTQAARAELERARHTHRPVVSADRDLRRSPDTGPCAARSDPTDTSGCIPWPRRSAGAHRAARAARPTPRRRRARLRRRAACDRPALTIQLVPSRPSAATPDCSSTSAPPATTARRTPSQNDSGRTRRSTRAIRPPSTRFAQRRLDRAQLGGRHPFERPGDPQPRELVRRLPQVLELGLLERRIQQRIVMKLELHAALGQPIERRPGERAGLLERRRALADMRGAGSSRRTARSRRASRATAWAGSITDPTD